MADGPSTIFLCSLEPWSDMWYSKHHYAAHLARENTVYFVSLPDKWRWTDLFSTGVKVRLTPEGVRIVEYRNNLPLSALPGWLARSVELFNASKLRRLMPTGEVIFWCFHPISSLQELYLKDPRSRFIYHVVDPYQNLPNDRLFARRSDLVVTINQWYERYYSEVNPNCILIPHGVRTEDRFSDSSVVKDLQEQWGRYMILATGLNRFVNYELLLRIASRFKSIRLVIVGQIFPVDQTQKILRDELFQLPNVTYAGIKHPDELKNIIRGAFIGLLTYDFETTHSLPVKAGRTPLKVLTYLSQLCPVVSTNNSYVPILDGAGYYKAEDPDHFLSLINDLLEGRIGVVNSEVEPYLDSVEYGQLIEQIFDNLRSNGNEPAPVVSKAEEPILDPVVQATTASSPDPKLIPKDSPILIISNEGWYGPRYSKHRYALALREYRDVFFIDPPEPWNLSHLFRSAVVSRKSPEGITVLSYNNAIPLFGGLLSGINDRIISHRLSKFLRRLGCLRPLFWSFDPRRLSAPSSFQPVVSVYHCADDYGLRWRSERFLAKRCDHVFCVAHDLMPRFDSLNDSVHYMPHGLSDDDLSPATLERSELPAPPGYGLYIGNINDRHDFALWEKMFLKNPEVTWVIVGPVQVTDPKGIQLIHGPTLPNVRILPPVPFSFLRTFIAGAGFGFMYLKKDHPANRISSQKVVQFLGQGKAVFSSWLSEYSDRQDLVYMSDDHDSAIELFRTWKSSSEPEHYKTARSEYAKEQRFTNLIARLPFRL